MAALGKILCPKHGLVTWQGHVECSACFAVFQTQRRLADDSAPHTCPCGAALLPKPMTDDPFTARCYCSICYKDRVPATPKGQP